MTDVCSGNQPTENRSKEQYFSIQNSLKNRKRGIFAN